MIVDDYATHKHPDVLAWLETHERVHLHFTPTSSSWLNLVERFCAEITNQAIRRGVFKNVRELEEAISAYLMKRNGTPHPYTWTATNESILNKMNRARLAPNAVTTPVNSDSVHQYQAQRSRPGVSHRLIASARESSSVTLVVTGTSS